MAYSSIGLKVADINDIFASNDRYVFSMASLVIRNLDDRTKSRLRLRAAANDRSMEEEARSILRTALTHPQQRNDLFAEVRQLVDKYGPADDLALPSDEFVEPMTFE